MIGLGVGEQHAKGLAAHRNCVLAAVCDLDEKKRLAAAALYPNARIYDRAEALIDDPDIDLVCVASYDDDHHDQIRRALEGGKHVFAEKPLCISPEETSSIRAALRRRPDLRLTSNTILRLSPRFQALREDMRGGRLGRLFCIEGGYQYGRLWKLTDGWRGRIPGYSVVLGGGIHIADLLLWLTGQRIQEVFAIGNRIASADRGFAGDDIVMALLTFADGMIGKLSVNFGCVEPHFHRLSVYGTEATFENGREHALLWRSRDPAVPPEQIATPYSGVAKHALLSSFVDHILGGGQAVVDEEDVFAAMSVCHAIDRSVQSGRPVVVEYL